MVNVNNFITLKSVVTAVTTDFLFLIHLTHNM